MTEERRPPESMVAIMANSLTDYPGMGAMRGPLEESLLTPPPAPDEAPTAGGRPTKRLEVRPGQSGAEGVAQLPMPPDVPPV